MLIYSIFWIYYTNKKISFFQSKLYVDYRSRDYVYLYYFKKNLF